MPMSGFICHDDYRKKTERLTDEQLGRVFRALMLYHETGYEPELDSLESMAFDFIRVDIDRTEKEHDEKCKKNREIRLEAIEKQRTLTNVDERDQEKKRKENEKENENEKKTSFLDIDDATEIQHDHDRILDAAEDAGFKMTNNVRASLIALYADNGLEKVLAGLRSCSEHGATTLAYLRACMKDEPKKIQTKPSVPAQAYTQRSYDGEQEEALRRMLRAVN